MSKHGESVIEMCSVDKNNRFQVNKVAGTVNVNENNHKEFRKLDTNGCENDDDEDDFEVTELLSSVEKSRINYELASDTKYGKSFRHMTREALPRMDNYRNIMSIQAACRPTLDELHNATLLNNKPSVVQFAEDKNVESTNGQIKFGWIQGVLIRCLLNIWGVMLFLRLSWVVAQVGIGESILLILTTTVVTVITSLSMSAISTNGVIKGGGTYYMISRSLGPEFGGSIGLIFSLANAVACALYVVGFCESLNDLLSIYDLSIIDGKVQDVRIIGCITLLCLTCIVMIGMEWETKAQIGLLVILLAAIVNFLIGSFMGPKNDLERAKGFIGFNFELLKENFYPDYRYSDGVYHNFFSVFSIFFPAATGILAGANISGDLKDPQKSIPKGTLLAIVITTMSYIIIAIICGWTMMRDASGDLFNLTCSDNLSCKYGLHNNKQIVALISWQEWLIYAGCFAATLSSALASLVSAPKVFQALCNDKLYPAIEWFGRGYGPNYEPVRGYILTFVIAIAFILIGELDLIAPLISNFFLAAYALINFSTFHASLAKPVGWRPTFRYYNMWLSLIGTFFCVIIMFLISWATALVTFAALFSLYLIVQYRKPDVNWGSTTQAQTFKNALLSVQQLNRVEEHVKNYRPQILVLSGFPCSRQPLIDFAYSLTRNISLLICGQISEKRISQSAVNALNYKSNQWLSSQKIKAFYSLVDDTTFLDGAKALLQASGLGKLRPNILLMGYKSDWKICPRKDLNSYFDVVHKALDMHLAVTILRLKNGFEAIKISNDECSENGNNNLSIHRNTSSDSFPRNQSCSRISYVGSVTDLSCNNTNNESQHSQKPTIKRNSCDETFTEVTKGDPYVEQFLKKQKKGTIDVWWLYDDGGLTLLLPYILSTRQNWQDCRLRVFAIANKTTELEFEHRNMASLLSKFRIDYLDLTILPDITKKPMDETRKQFESLICDFMESAVLKPTEQTNGKFDSNVAIITESELLSMQEKTNRHLRLRELLVDHSSDATLIVMTLPVPRKSVISAPLYMAWIEMLSKDMPPFLFVRGNQTSVLTFYS